MADSGGLRGAPGSDATGRDETARFTRGGDPPRAESAESTRFDPRFDPAFQPGYDPQSDPAALARGVPRALRPAPESRPVPSPAGTPEVEIAPPDAVATPESARVDDPADDAAPAPRGNPFIIALWALSALFALVGVALMRWVPELELQLQRSNSLTSYVTLMSLTIFAPMLIVLALTAATGILFLYATRWRKRAATRD